MRILVAGGTGAIGRPLIARLLANKHAVVALTRSPEKARVLAEQGNPGIYLIANDRPLAVREWLPAFAQRLSAPPPPQGSVEDALQASDADAVYFGTQMRGFANAKARRELAFRPRPLEWIGGTAT